MHTCNWCVDKRQGKSNTRNSSVNIDARRLRTGSGPVMQRAEAPKAQRVSSPHHVDRLGVVNFDAMRFFTRRTGSLTNLKKNEALFACNEA